MTITLNPLTESEKNLLISTDSSWLDGVRLEEKDASIALGASLSAAQPDYLMLSMQVLPGNVSASSEAFARAITRWVYQIAHDQNLKGVCLMLEPDNPLISDLNEFGFRRVGTQYTTDFKKNSTPVSLSDDGFLSFKEADSAQRQAILETLNGGQSENSRQIASETLLADSVADLPLIHLGDDDTIDAVWAARATTVKNVLESVSAWSEDEDVLSQLVRFVAAEMSRRHIRLQIRPADGDSSDFSILQVLSEVGSFEEKALYLTIF